MKAYPPTIYRINKEDRIVFTNSAWDTFALENDAPDMTSESVVDRSLWDFICDETTRQLYSHILAIARMGRILRFDFHCDSPGKIRLMEMTVSSERDAGVQFRTRTLKASERPEQKILSRTVRRSDQFIQMCSWCKAIDTGNDEWRDLDESISHLEVFKHGELPKLTHGICKACYKAVSKERLVRKVRD
jgi:hypothetical protein